MVAQYGSKVRFVSENFGASPLAERFGITLYPAVFVDDVLVANPRDFGFYGSEQKPGRYTPWIDAASHARFKQDLVRMINLILAGKKNEAKTDGANADDQSEQITSLPNFQLQDLQGRTLRRDEFAGRIVIVEFWATWCPPCRSTLEWLRELQRKYGNQLAVLAVAVESPEDQVRGLAGSLGGDVHWAIGTPEVARAFGDVVAVPTMFMFDEKGKIAGTWFGAPPDLHVQVEKVFHSVVTTQ